MGLQDPRSWNENAVFPSLNEWGSAIQSGRISCRMGENGVCPANGRHRHVALNRIGGWSQPVGAGILSPKFYCSLFFRRAVDKGKE